MKRNISTVYYLYCLLGELFTSINYGESFPFKLSNAGYSIQYGSLSMSSDGTKVIAAVYGLGK